MRMTIFDMTLNDFLSICQDEENVIILYNDKVYRLSEMKSRSKFLLVVDMIRDSKTNTLLIMVIDNVLYNVVDYYKKYDTNIILKNYYTNSLNVINRIPIIFLTARVCEIEYLTTSDSIMITYKH